jgi:hypothetical protein
VPQVLQPVSQQGAGQQARQRQRRRAASASDVAMTIVKATIP